MNASPPTRVNYFDRQFIRLAELRDEQAYHVQLRRRHNLSHHSWGIVLGLDIARQDDGRPAVLPGLAIDGYGRELLLVDRQVVGRETFDRYVTSRLDVWLVYELELVDDRLAPSDCDGDPRRRYRATERARVEFTRGGARPDPRHPPGVPLEALEEPLLSTPDDPRRRWPVYLGRVIMDLPPSGTPTFEIDAADRVYVGLTAEAIDHPGNESRVELGRRPAEDDARTIDDTKYIYAKGPARDFGVFVPQAGAPADEVTLDPVIAVEDGGTQIRGSVSVHGNLVLDGASLQFPATSSASPADTENHPAIYRATDDELRIDIGSLNGGERKLVIGVTKDGEFNAAITISFPNAMSTGGLNPLVTVHGDLRIEGIIESQDVRTRTVTEEVAALLTGMVQAGITTA